MSAILSLKNVIFRYRAEENLPPAVNDVSFDIEEGQFVALVGHNGSGKSTLARLLNGLLLPESGEIRVADIPTSDAKRLFELRRQIGLVFQNPDNQMVATIVEDDVAFGPENIGVPPAEIEERVRYALNAVGMAEFRQSSASRMSGGQKQRIAIAGALALHPKILVLDESTAMLDPKGRREVMEVIQALNRTDGITVILITHFMQEAALADRVLVMDDGVLAMDGSPAEIFAREAELTALGLDVPFPVKVKNLLAEQGIVLKGDALTDEELVEAIWQYRSKD